MQDLPAPPAASTDVDHPSADAPPPEPRAPLGRILALDAVRGLAVLGILVMNVVEFGLPIRAYENPAAAGGSSGADLATWLVQQTLFDGKMRALFSMLFGAGLVLLGEREERTGRSGADLLLRRCLWLVPFGIAHRFLLQWTGDILYIYGLIGLIAIAFRRARPARQIVLGVLFLSAFVPIEAWRYHQAAELRADAIAAEQLIAAGEEVPAPLREARTRWDRRTAPPDPEALRPEIEALRGSYATVFAYRWDYHHAFQSGYVYSYFVWDVLGTMLVGMGLLRLRFFHGAWSTRAYVAVLAAAALAAGAAFLLARAWAATQWSAGALELRAVRGATYPHTRLLVGLGWAAALLLVLRAGALRRVTGALAAVGRLAFTNYVLQTVCCTLLFFGYGLGWYGSLSRAELMVVWLAVSLVQVAFSLLWLRCFPIGPLEWAWRRLVAR